MCFVFIPLDKENAIKSSLWHGQIFKFWRSTICVIISYSGYIPTDAFCHCSRHCDVTTRPMVSIVVHSRGDLLLWASVMACLNPRDTGRRTFGSKFRQNVAKNVAKSGMKSLPLRLVGFTACVTVTPLTHVTCYGWDSNTWFHISPSYSFLFLWWIYLSFISVIIFLWFTIVNWASPKMLRLTKKQYNPILL